MNVFQKKKRRRNAPGFKMSQGKRMEDGRGELLLGLKCPKASGWRMAEGRCLPGLSKRRMCLTPWPFTSSSSRPCYCRPHSKLRRPDRTLNCVHEIAEQQATGVRLPSRSTATAATMALSYMTNKDSAMCTRIFGNE